MERRIAHILNLGGDDNLRLARFSEKIGRRYFINRDMKLNCHILLFFFHFKMVNRFIFDPNVEVHISLTPSFQIFSL